jgi:molecular chaperone DnaK
LSVAIGIDLGTTNTVVAAVVDGVAVTLEDEEGRRLLPSVVSFHPSGDVLVGEAARERRLIDPENTIFSIKPLIGRTFDSDEVRAARARLPFRLVQGAKDSTMVVARDVSYALPEISAFVLRRAKAIAERALGQTVDRAVITVPANFNDLQRASTKIAGKLAGLEVMRILNEPTAAALAYGQSITKAEKIGVYDLGGGTFDITLLDLTGNVFEVLATAGDTSLGGDDIDAALAEQLAIEVVKRFNFDPRTNPVTFGRLRFIAEDIKKALSEHTVIERDVTGIGYGEGGHPIVMKATVTREQLEQLTMPLLERTISVAKQSIEIIGLHPKDFDRVLLVGGSTRMPLVARAVEQLFGRPPHLKVNPDEVVALGAAIQAHALNRSKAAKQKPPSSPPAAGAHDPAPVPRAPRLPEGVAAPPAPPPPLAFELSKAPAVITFTPPSPAEIPDLVPPPPRPPPRKPPPPMPTRKVAAIDAAAIDAAVTRGAESPIDSRAVRPDDGPVQGPKPPRTSAAPSPAPPSPPPARRIASGTYSERPEPRTRPSANLRAGAPAPEAGAPELDLPLPPAAAHGQIVAEEMEIERGNPMPPAPPQPALEAPPAPAPAREAFQRGSAIATSAEAPLLIDVTPLSLRVETVGGYSDVLIAANSPVPCEKARRFLTASDQQTVVFIRVAQGESPRFAENTYLGELELSGLKPAPRGAVKISVTFELDADGILNVRAKDEATGRETKATMRIQGTQDAGEIAAMAARQARHVVV